LRKLAGYSGIEYVGLITTNFELGDHMSIRVKKERPAGVPEENIYDSMHWTLLVALAAVCVTIYLAVNAG